MKGIVILAFCVLAGCATGPTLEQLEADALMTGDWSLVEKREQQLRRRQMRAAYQCPNGYIAVCVRQVVNERCSCVDRRTFDIAFASYR